VVIEQSHRRSPSYVEDFAIEPQRKMARSRDARWSGYFFTDPKYTPWRIKTAMAFTDRKKALDFEAYLKSASGRAFAKKRL
jgi:hypothetical protein